MTNPANTSPGGDCQSSTQIQRHARIARWSAFAVLAWMFLPLFTGRIYVCDDLLNYHLPIRQFYARCLQQGDSFDWMPGLFSGYFLTGSGQAGTYHPLHWMLYRFLSLNSAFNLEILSSYPFMLFGMKLFLQRHLGRPDAAWLGAIVFTFSGFCTLHFLHPNAIAVVSHIPWLLLAIDVILRSDRQGGGQRIAAETGIALLTGSQLLLGYPQYVWFSLLAESIYCLGFVRFSSRGIRDLSLITLLKILGLGLGAAQILPSMEALAASDRASMPAEYFFQHPLTSADMLQWVNPFLTKSRVFGESTHELGVYCGALPLLLLIVALCRIRTRFPERRLVQVMLALGLIALWLSFGKAGGLYVAQTWLPLVGKFRWPSRIIVLLHFVTAVLAAVGYSQLTPISKQRSGLPKVIFFIPLLSIIASLLVFQMCPRDRVASTGLLIIGPILVTLAAVMLRDLSHGKMTAAFMLFIAGDLAAYGFTYEALNKTQTIDQIVSGLESPPGRPDEGRIIVESHPPDRDVEFRGNALLLAGWRQADGYEGLLPRMPLHGQDMTLDALRISGVKWIANSGRQASIKGLRPTSDTRWLEVPDPLPRVRLSNHTHGISDTENAVRFLSADGPVIVENPAQGLLNAEEGFASATLTEDRPGNILIRSQSQTSQFLVLSERYSPFWRASIDGVPVQILRTESEFMGCLVPPGNHSIQFVFDAASVRHGLQISVSVLILLIACCLGRCIVGRRKVSPETPR